MLPFCSLAGPSLGLIYGGGKQAHHGGPPVCYGWMGRRRPKGWWMEQLSCGPVRSWVSLIGDTTPLPTFLQN